LHEKKLDVTEWHGLIKARNENTNFYEHLLNYGRQEPIELKLSDEKFMEKYALFLINELYGNFRADYSIAIDKGDTILFIFEEKRKLIPDLIGEGKMRSIILEKKTGKIIAISKTRS
jgi:hypothetical protein